MGPFSINDQHTIFLLLNLEGQLIRYDFCIWKTGLVHVLAHALVAQDLVHVPEAVVEMIDAVDAMTLTAEVKGRADQGSYFHHTFLLKTNAVFFLFAISVIRSHSRSESRDRSRSHSKSPRDNGDTRGSVKDDREAEGDRDADRRSRDREDREGDNGREDRHSNDRERRSNDRDVEDDRRSESRSRSPSRSRSASK